MYLNKTKPVWIFGAPRSGTSWLGQIFNSSQFVNYKLQPLFSYAFKDQLSLNSTVDELNLFLKEVENSNDPFINGEADITNHYPKFYKNNRQTHLVLKHVRYHHLIKHLLDLQPNAKVIGIIRNPYAVINSWLKAPREFNPSWDKSLEWREANKKNMGRVEEFYGFNKWLEIYKLYKKLANDESNSFYLLYYDNLISTPIESVRMIFDFCDLPFGNQTETFLEKKKIINSNPYSIDKVKLTDTDWKQSLSPSIADEITNVLRFEEIEEFVINYN